WTGPSGARSAPAATGWSARSRTCSRSLVPASGVRVTAVPRVQSASTGTTSTVTLWSAGFATTRETPETSSAGAAATPADSPAVAGAQARSTGGCCGSSAARPTDVDTAAAGSGPAPRTTAGPAPGGQPATGPRPPAP